MFTTTPITTCRASSSLRLVEDALDVEQGRQLLRGIPREEFRFRLGEGEQAVERGRFLGCRRYG
jgi:hypothetical protein